MDFFAKNIAFLPQLKQEFLSLNTTKALPICGTKNLKELSSNYNTHPALFINGINDFCLEILKSTNLKHLIIFDDDIKLIFSLLKSYDLSTYLKEKRLFIFYSKEFDFAKAKTLFLNNHFMFYSEIFSLLNFKNDEFFIEKNIKLAIASIKLALQSSQESIKNIEHFCANLSKTLTHTSVKDFLNQRQAKDKNALIIASGPSLSKQLPLLKNIQENISIFCTDGSYNILQKHGIKPDYVFCIERDFVNGNFELNQGSYTFFENDFGEFDKDIIFILADTTNPHSIKLLEKNDRKYIIVLSNSFFARSFKMDDYGYCDLSFSSVANFAYNFALSLKYTNIFLIGQDLAYNQDGHSHPKEFLHSSKAEDKIQDRFLVTAYGGKGEVFTHAAWNLYKEKYESDIKINQFFIKTYNCTEGGARIEGAIEIPFKEACKNFIKQKDFCTLKNTSFKKENIISCLKHFHFILEKGLKFIKDGKYLIKQIQELNSLINHFDANLSLEQSLASLDFVKIQNLENEINTYKTSLFNEKIFSDILISYLYVNECNFMKLKIKNKDKTRAKIDQLSFIINHERHFNEIFSLIKQQNIIISKTIADIEKELKEYE